MISRKIFTRRSPFTGLFLFILQFGLFCQTNERIITSSSGDDRHPWWSPDGKQLVFESNRDGDWELFIINADGSNERKLTDNTFEDRNPTWHPDGSKLLFESNRSGSGQLYSLDLKDQSVNLIPLKNFNYEPTTARYSPDGSQIAFCAIDNSSGVSQLNLFLTSGTGGAVKQLTFDTTRSFYPSWSSDSKKLVFFSRRDTKGVQDELYIMDLDNENLSTTRVTNYPFNDFCPHWSSTGDRLVFSSSLKDARPDLFISNADGSNTRQITFTPNLGETQAVWSPDGKTIAYAGYRGGSYEICLISTEH